MSKERLNVHDFVVHDEETGCIARGEDGRPAIKPSFQWPGGWTREAQDFVEKVMGAK